MPGVGGWAVDGCTCGVKGESGLEVGSKQALLYPDTSQLAYLLWG